MGCPTFWPSRCWGRAATQNVPLEAGASEIVDPRALAVGRIAAAFENYPHIGKVLPALGYSQSQLDELRATINGSQADVVVSGTPIDIARIIAFDKPVVRARYEFADVDTPGLDERLEAFLKAGGRMPEGTFSRMAGGGLTVLSHSKASSLRVINAFDANASLILIRRS